ncbi:MAG: amidase [Pseudomonadota bacterium]
MNELIKKSASEVIALLQSGEITTDDTLKALQQRIDQVDGKINALPTLCFERAHEAAKSVNRNSVLAGLPVAIKDLNDVAGVRTTYGSLAYENHVPDTTGMVVQQIENNGGVVYAKSNTPEFGSGAQTFNEVFGVSRNPYNYELTTGGSSGGAAAALASGTAWLAQGSDLGGSLRTPASFCGVTSLRPSPGVIAMDPGDEPFEVYAQNGPMARDITDLALFADAMAGKNPRAGLTKSHPESQFRDAASKPVKPAKVAFSVDLGVTEIDSEIADVFSRAISQLEGDHIPLASSHPDLSMADAAFDTPRALGYALGYGPDLDDIRDLIKPENVWNIELGLKLSNEDIRGSMKARGQIFNNARQFMTDYDLLICPVSMVPAFPVDERYHGYSEGLPWSEYYRWLRIVYAITVTTLPVITIPCGKTEKGMPVGLQLVGKPHGERALFAQARYLEQIFNWDKTQLIR